MANAIIFTNINSEIDIKIDILANYCRDNKLSIIKEYSIYAKHKDTHYVKNLLEDITTIPNEHINVVFYSIEDLSPNTEFIELFKNLIKTGKVSLHFIKENLIYNSQTPASEIVRLNLVILMSKYHNFKSIPETELQSLADKIYITQMQEAIKDNLLKNQ